MFFCLRTTLAGNLILFSSSCYLKLLFPIVNQRKDILNSRFNVDLLQTQTGFEFYLKSCVCKFWILKTSVIYNYRPPMKLLESNAFSHVCSEGGSPCEHYPWCAEPHCKAPLPTRHGTLPVSDIWSPSPKTCSNLFIRPHWTGLAPLVLTSGGHRRLYGWGDPYPTGMLSCKTIKTSHKGYEQMRILTLTLPAVWSKMEINVL